MTETKKQQKFEFICMDEDCLREGQNPCLLTFYAEEEPDYPSYCPWEFEPREHKYKPWKKVKG